MRKDFGYPHRIITRKEEIQSTKSFGFLFGIILGTLIFYPFTFILKVVEYLIKKCRKIIVVSLWCLLCFFVSYWIFSNYIFN